MKMKGVEGDEIEKVKFKCRRENTKRMQIDKKLMSTISIRVIDV